MRARAKPWRGEVGEQRLVGALAAPHDRREHLEAGALGQLQDAVDDLLRRLARDARAVVRAVRHADAGVEQAEVVVDLGDRADRRARVARGRLLVDRDGRRQALDEVDVGLVHLAEELAGVGRQRLDVAALALGVDRVERERRLARARQAGEDDELVARQLERDVLQVVLAGAPDDERVGHPTSVPASAARSEQMFGQAAHVPRGSPRRPTGTRGPHALELEPGVRRRSVDHAIERVVQVGPRRRAGLARLARRRPPSRRSSGRLVRGSSPSDRAQPAPIAVPASELAPEPRPDR